MAERGPLVGLRSFFFGGGVFLAAARQRNEEKELPLRGKRNEKKGVVSRRS